MHMQITVKCGRYNEDCELWPAIEHAIGALSGYGNGRLTRISRPDGACNYRSAGHYELTYTPERGDNVAVTLKLV